jgi:hypothetical protein
MPADLFGFGDRKSTNTRLGPAKVPHQVLISYTWLPLRDPWLAPSKKRVNINVFQITVVATLVALMGRKVHQKKMLSG